MIMFIWIESNEYRLLKNNVKYYLTLLKKDFN
jgi:hypothetical protein